ncbi:uncharacterized protein LY89DRAFT_732051 [Mollisia scopiformis]|uniref:RNase H type-1 domain-containing protein n=1 Tax=Mollisia scopiformis TaxID=149040 RepID=A0A194XFE6_MOLSC|nr:uncharacterized protein LY89DRAFT_732051 [Mollisia scopiformis]KUJ18492.1 hypothetical protein LY89DRAFT_732051 [Mollisia scopiformis]
MEGFSGFNNTWTCKAHSELDCSVCRPLRQWFEVLGGSLVCRLHRKQACSACPIATNFWVGSTQVGSTNLRFWKMKATDFKSFTIPELALPLTSLLQPSLPTPLLPSISLDNLGNAPHKMNRIRLRARAHDNSMMVYIGGYGKPKSGFAAAAFIYDRHHTDQDTKSGIALKLEKLGPYGELSTQCSVGASLRAAIAVLQYKNWADEFEGEASLVITTCDKDVSAARKRISEWREKIKVSKGTVHPTSCRGLWQLFAWEIEAYKARNMTVRMLPVTKSEISHVIRLAKSHLESYTTHQEEDFRALRGYMPSENAKGKGGDVRESQLQEREGEGSGINSEEEKLTFGSEEEHGGEYNKGVSGEEGNYGEQNELEDGDREIS